LDHENNFLSGCTLAGWFKEKSGGAIHDDDKLFNYFLKHHCMEELN